MIQKCNAYRFVPYLKIILILCLISPLNNIFRLDVIHSNVIEIIISIVGWIYFVSWSLSSYPQLILNWQTKEYIIYS